jgi:hypothetical protein
VVVAVLLLVVGLVGEVVAVLVPVVGVAPGVFCLVGLFGEVRAS